MRSNLLFTADAMQAATAFVVSQTTHIEREVNQTIYPDIQYASLIPVDTSAHPFTQTVTFFSMDKFGAAKWINGNAGDIPLVGSERDRFQSAVYSAGIGYGFGYEEVNVAMMSGVNLQADDAQTARRASEEFVDGIALRGDAAKGMKGLINYSGITTTAAAAAWGSATEAQILGDINNAILGIGQDTLYTSMADTVLMSPEKVAFLANKKYADTSMTMLEWVMKYNTRTALTKQPLDIRGVRGLETAGGSNSQRMVAYRKSPEVLKLHYPMPHRFLPVWQDGPVHWVVPGIFRLGGLDIRRPKEVRYVDGI